MKNERKQGALAKVLEYATWPHEAVHYLAARAFGLRAEIRGTQTVLFGLSRSQNAVVTAAPLVVGLLFIPLAMWLTTDASGYVRLSVLGMFAGWFWVCGRDIADLAALLRS